MTINAAPPAKPKPKAKPALRENFARFFEDPSRDKLHDLLKGSGGEFRDLDFKVEWPSKAHVAKQVLGLANIGGGVLVVGVQEGEDGGLTPVGLEAFTDKADITGWLKGIIPSGLLNDVEVYDFDYPGGEYGVIQGKKFQVMFVSPDDDQSPFLPLKEGAGIVPGTVYVRRDGMVEAATYDEVQRILNNRISRGHSTQPTLDLKSHFEQLRFLYGEIQPQSASLGWLGQHFKTAEWIKALGSMTEPNPLYPAESFEKFVSNQIEAKKRVIKRLLGTD